VASLPPAGLASVLEVARGADEHPGRATVIANQNTEAYDEANKETLPKAQYVSETCEPARDRERP